MAKLGRILKCDLYSLMHDIDEGIRHGNVSASLEEETEYDIPGGKVMLRVYERYSFLGGNRVSLTILAVNQGGTTRLCATCTGGSSGIFFKLNTVGEGAFLEKLEKILAKYDAQES